MSALRLLPALRTASSSRCVAHVARARPVVVPSRSLSSSLAAQVAAAAHRAAPAAREQHKRAGPSFAKKWGTRVAVALAIPVAFLIGAAYPPQLMLIFNPRYSPPPPELNSAHGKALVEATEKELQDLFLVAKMRNKGEEWYETRPYERYDPQKVHNSLTAGSLRGPGKLAIPPIAFARKDETEAVIIVHLGRALCGHDGIIHGGLLATIFDESLARNALMNIPSHIGVTANLNINYRSPCMADQFVVVRTELEQKKGRKVVVAGRMETLDGERIADATAIFVEPKWAQFLQSSGVTESLGVPETPKLEVEIPEPTHHAVRV